MRVPHTVRPQLVHIISQIDRLAATHGEEYVQRILDNVGEGLAEAD